LKDLLRNTTIGFICECKQIHNNEENEQQDSTIQVS